MQNHVREAVTYCSTRAKASLREAAHFDLKLREYVLESYLLLAMNGSAQKTAHLWPARMYAINLFLLMLPLTGFRLSRASSLHFTMIDLYY